MRRPPFPTQHPSVTAPNSRQETQHTPFTGPLFLCSHPTFPLTTSQPLLDLCPPPPYVALLFLFPSVFYLHSFVIICLTPVCLYPFPPLLSSPLLSHAPGCCSDTEADSVFKMANNKDSVSYRRSLVVTPKTTTQFNQFLPTKDKSSGYVPAPLRKKRAERTEDNRRSWASPAYTEEDGSFTRYRHTTVYTWP